MDYSHFRDLQSPSKNTEENALLLTEIYPFFFNSLNPPPTIQQLTPNPVQKSPIYSKIHLFSIEKTQFDQIQWKKANISLKTLFPNAKSPEFTSPFIKTPLPSILGVLFINPSILIRNFPFVKQEIGFWAQIKGKWVLITLENLFPYQKGLYPFTASEASFIMILEKALAGVLGSYERLFACSIKGILRMIIGSPIDQISLEDSTEGYIKSCFYRGFLIYLQDKEKKEAFALSEIIEEELKGSLYKVKTGNKEILERLAIKIGNIGIIKEGEGDWGFIILDFAMIKEFLPCVNVIRFHENYCYKWLELFEEKNLILLNTENSLHFYITISLDRKANFRLLLVKDNNGKLEFVKGFYCSKKVFSFEEYLDTGTYKILFEVCKGNNAVLSIYSGSQEVVLKDLGVFGKEFLKLEEGIFKEIAASNVFKTQCSFDYKNSFKEVGVQCFWDYIYGCFYLFYLNKGKKKLQEKIKVIRKDTGNTLGSCEVVVEPNQEIIILYKDDISGLFKKSDTNSFETQRETSFESANGPFIQEDIIPGFNSNLHHEKLLSKVSNSSEPRCHKSELIRLLKEQGKKVKRIWDHEEIEVSCYNFIHEEGVVFLYTNYTYFPYEENVVWELDNLKIENPNEEGVVRFQLEPYSEFLLFLKRISQEESFSFKTKSFYKYYPEK